MKPQQTTPITPDPSRALARALHALVSGYCYYTKGEIDRSKVVHLCEKFHEKFGIGLTATQRKARKAAGQANAMLVLLQPLNHTKAYWLLLATAPLEGEKMRHARAARLEFCDYEFFEHTAEGKMRWTVRMNKDWYQELRETLIQYRKEQDWKAFKFMVDTISKEPGYHGIREQKYKLFELASRVGYPEKTPFIPVIPKLTHGDLVTLTPRDLKLRPKKTA